MSNQLVPKEISGGALSTDFADVIASAKTFLDRLQLFGSKSDACAEGKIAIGRYGIVKDKDIVDLGPEIDVVIIAWRSKALQITPDDILVCFDIKDKLYEEIKVKSEVKDSGCMHGPEFLIWIPSESVFVTYHMSSKTARREAKKMEPLLGKAAIFKVQLIDPPKSRYKWHGPVIMPCSAALEVPSMEEIQTVVDVFNNPPKSEVELADEDESNRER